ncbi:hypothetical protein KC351_g3629 [Hortaea werneckii]|nr:hypothetical protein KC351_g3629 [Hortaea werneckii]
MSGSTAHGSDEYNKADRVLTRDVKLNPHPELANYHSEPTTLPVAEVLRKDPEKEKQAANTESGEEEGGRGSEDSDDLMDAEEWENRFTDLPSLNDEEEEKWERTFYDTDNFGDDEDSFDDLNDVDEEEDEEVAEDRKNAARVRAHFAHIYPDFKTKRGAWNAFDMDTADPPFDTRDEDILTRISQYYVAVVPTVRDFPRPPNSMLRQALQEGSARMGPPFDDDVFVDAGGGNELGKVSEDDL